MKEYQTLWNEHSKLQRLILYNVILCSKFIILLIVFETRSHKLTHIMPESSTEIVLYGLDIFFRQNMWNLKLCATPTLWDTRDSLIAWTSQIIHLLSHFGPWGKSLNLIFCPTKCVIPKSLKVSHWMSKFNKICHLLWSWAPWTFGPSWNIHGMPEVW